MKSPNSPVSSLKQMLALEERRAALQKKLDAVAEQLASLSKNLFTGAAPTGRPRGRPAKIATAAPAQSKIEPVKRRRKIKRGQLSATIMEALKAAGSNGITVTALADKLGAKYKNIYIWFATTGKKKPDVKKIAPATYRLA
jgi:hypothetical protein